MFAKLTQSRLLSGFVVLMLLVIWLLLNAGNKLSAYWWIGDMVEKPLPPFTQLEQSQWINSSPLTVESLKGKVVLLDFWTFGCWNCYRSFPWLNSLEPMFPTDFQIIGIHTPEFEYEKNLTSIANKVKEFKLHHPIMVDSDKGYWRAMNNRYWPSFYLIDKQGIVRHLFIGETHKNDNRATKIQLAIKQLLAE